MVRGSGKFKQKRGGGRSFSRNLVLDENGTAVASERPRRNQGEDDDDSSEEEEEEDEEEEDDEEEEEEEEEDKPELSRAERKELKKKQAAEKQKQKQKAGNSTGGDGEDDEDDDSDLINPNHVTKKMNISDLSAPRELTRKEREAKEKQEAKDRYWKLHVQGKTEEAKTDLQRLAKIRAEREAAQAKRKAETEAKQAELDAKVKASQNKRKI
ncbi:hypothetical protein K435DRAFT_783483 [Dendrothele bispora CBS 962.96]|uniref:Casein kinase substrate phosphoprotein PP28 domain-containing protein n=1 Tax=Dendrothele bispora (strain CBS 962.96) TaxID=1314807 RepID=A0A4S8L984_DENBC|nr:hypothetical protein K435DRAFT_783483 [Dendrothele bispora CBS 962.96]